jgi:hypothetical protein
MVTLTSSDVNVPLQQRRCIVALGPMLAKSSTSE